MTISNMTEEVIHGAAGNAPASDASQRPASAARTTPRERPILFSAPMVRALLSGVKTQTRRIVKLPSPDGEVYVDPGGTIFGPGPYVKNYPPGYPSGGEPMHQRIRCPYGYPGDRLWVRETHCAFHVGEGMDPVPECVAYRATTVDDSFDYVNTRGEILGLTVTKWTPSIFMPRWASRIALEVTGVRVERLQDISEDDARAEGVDGPASGEWPAGFGSWSHKGNRIDGRPWAHAYLQLWMQINGHESAHANPWVWAITFKRVA